MTKQTYYALRNKGGFRFFCIASSLLSFQRKIEDAFWSWKGLQSKGENKTYEDYMTDIEKVKISIEVIK